jgi:hypothetical protein
MIDFANSRELVEKKAELTRVREEENMLRAEIKAQERSGARRS